MVNPEMYKWAVLPYTLFVILPYLVLIFGWGVYALRDKKSGWYDEKQRSDIYKSGAFTLLISIPLMLILFLLNFEKIDGSIAILWLPFYLFVVVLVFSLTALYNYKTN